MRKLSKKPGFWSGGVGAIARELRNRVSEENLGVDAKIIKETRFLRQRSVLHQLVKKR
ncbi:MAG: hypothetical protein AB4352_00290 [Hormoscilla sp.]